MIQDERPRRRTIQSHFAALRLCVQVLAREHQSMRAPDCLMTFAHFAVSVLMWDANWLRVLPTATRPSAVSRSFISGLCMTAAICALSALSMSSVVPAGARTPYHWLDS